MSARFEAAVCPGMRGIPLLASVAGLGLCPMPQSGFPSIDRVVSLWVIWERCCSGMGHTSDRRIWNGLLDGERGIRSEFHGPCRFGCAQVAGEGFAGEKAGGMSDYSISEIAAFAKRTADLLIRHRDVLAARGYEVTDVIASLGAQADALLAKKAVCSPAVDSHRTHSADVGKDRPQAKAPSENPALLWAVFVRNLAPHFGLQDHKFKTVAHGGDSSAGGSDRDSLLHDAGKALEAAMDCFPPEDGFVAEACRIRAELRDSDALPPQPAPGPLPLPDSA